MTRKKIAILIIVLAALAAGIVFGMQQMRRQGSFLPSFITWKEKEESLDFTGDGQPETFLLKDRTFTLSASDEKVLFESEEGWKVSDYLTGDIDRDGSEDLLLLVWRIGNYGPNRPFWEEEKDETDYTQHIFIYCYQNDRVKPVWMSSDTGISIKDWSLDPDGTLHLFDDTGNESLWFWDNWGLTGV